MNLPSGIRPVKLKYLFPFCHQLAISVRSGLPLIRILGGLGRQTSSSNLKKIIEGIKSHLESGATFAEAVELYKDAFPPIFLESVRAGEISGRLEYTLTDLARCLERHYKFVSKLRAVLIYPCLQLLFAIGVMILITVLFGGFEAILTGFYILAAVVFLACFLIPRVKRKRKGQRVLTSLGLFLPLIGSLCRKVAMARFCRSLGLMLSSGLPVTKALKQAACSTGNIIIQEEIEKAESGLNRGGSLTESLGEVAGIPPLIMDMISVGEETGKIDETLNRAADWYEDSIHNTLSVIPKFLTIVTTVIIGLIVLYIIWKFYVVQYLGTILGIAGR